MLAIMPVPAMWQAVDEGIIEQRDY